MIKAGVMKDWLVKISLPKPIQRAREWWHAGDPKPAGPGYRQGFVRCLHGVGLHRMAYTEWGDPTNPKVLVCVHGLTRNGRDFDELAQALAPYYRVICPDVAGRGQSDWLPDKKAYGFPQYVADMVTLLAHLHVSEVDWVGTSMGGLIGMSLGALPKSPIRKMVLNDVGPLISRQALKRIATYVNDKGSWATLAEAGAYLRQIGKPFGSLTDAQWDHFAQYTFRQDADGLWRFAFDPGIGDPFKAEYLLQDVNLWPLYENLEMPLLVMRGAESDLLSEFVWREMGRRGPGARHQVQLLEVPGVGHAPMFTDDAQRNPVIEFLLDQA